MRGGRVGFIENRARLAQHHHARRMTVLRELWYCHVAVLSFHASSSLESSSISVRVPFFIRFSGAVLEVFWNSKWVMRHIVGKLSTSSFQRYKVCANRSSDEGVMAPGSRGVGAVFVHFSGEDSGQTGDAIGEPRVPRRSRSHYLSNAPGLADQLVASRKDSAREGGSCAAYFCKVPDSRESELGLVRYGPASRVHRGVFGPFEGSFPIRIPADPDKFLAIREFHVVHGCVLLSNVPGLADQLVASQEDSVRKRGNVGGKIPELSAKPYFVGLFSRAWGGQFDSSFWSGQWSGQTLVKLGQTWSTLVKLGRIWSKLSKLLEMYPGLHFKGFWARWVPSRAGNGSRSNLGQTSVNPSQTWSTLVKLGQTLGNVSRTFFLGVFDVASPRSSGSGWITRKTSNDPHVSKIDNKTDCSLDNIDNSDEEIELPSDILEALARQDEGSKPNIEELEIVNLANEGEEPREVKIGTRCAAEQKEALIALLREFHEIFAWSYQDMPGLDTDIVVHKIPLKPECKPVKQALRRMKPEVILKIKEEVEKQLKAGFLSTVTYSDWVANIVPVPKKDGKVRMCVDYRDLNRASPKDNFPLPHIDTLVDNTATNVVFSFMDGFSGYNQIKMAEEDKSKTAFITHWGTFVYDVMPFGLKNAGATYQRAMVTLFHDMIHHEIEVYVDDMIAKSRTAQDHLTDLRKLFQRLKKYQLRLNPNKCAFGVTSGKLLGFIVSGRGIEIDPAKVQAIRSMPAPKTEKEIRSFLGRINYTAREPFDKIKEYLLNPPILVPPTPGRPLILYLTVQEASMGCMLGQQDETGKKEQAIYYLSKKFTEPETRYLLVEKTCCALAWASKKLRQYMLYYTTWLVSRMDPIKYIFEKPALTGKIARWQVLLSEFDILFVARKAIKGQAIADYLADYPSEQLELNGFRIPRRRRNDSRRRQSWVDGSFTLMEQRTLSEVELARSWYRQRDNKLLSLLTENGKLGIPSSSRIQRYISRLVPKFKYVTFTYTPRAHNHFADALATLASLIKLVEGDDVRPLRIETRDIPAYCVCIEECMNVEAEIDNKPWYYDIKRFIQDREYPSRATENEKKYIRRMAFQFFLSGEILYKRTHDATLLRCVDAEEANRLIQEMHAGLMGAHANGPFLARKIMRAGYYWLTMERDCIRHVQTCHKCQMYQNSKNAPPQYLHTMASPWPFSAWGMDVIGAITPKASNGHEFILVAIDYFTKWRMLITDNASNLNNRMMDQLCQQFKIQHHNSAPYRPKMNGAVEAANKNVKKILSKMTETYKDWHEHLPYALCAYRTSVRTSVGATPYSLVYGMEAVLPVEVEIPSLRILSQTQLEEAEWAQARYEQLNFIDEKRLAALCHGQLYQRTDRKSLQQEGSTSHFPTRRSRSEEEEYGPIRSTRKVRTII
uniref:Integrase catalytic domain-containing protein n=1 Tax=Fagus sylvatica TaxID=28930 RepID=A0A2N9FVJ7_FAGSY